MRFRWAAIAATACLTPWGLLQAAEPSVAELTSALKGNQEGSRLSAIDRLGAKGPRAAEAIPALSGLLKNPSAAVRAHAADALGKIGPAARPAIADLVTLLGDSDTIVRRRALFALRQIHPGPDVGFPLFVKFLGDADPVARNHALQALAEAGKDAVPFLVDALKDDKTTYWACLVLREIGPEGKSAVPALTERLDDKRPEIRREALLALAEMSDAAIGALPKIDAALGDDATRVAATYALGRIGQLSPEIEGKIRAGTKSSDKLLAEVSVWALAKNHPNDTQLVREAVEVLVAGLKSKEQADRLMAARALAALQPSPEIAVPILDKSLREADEPTIGAALQALASLGPPAIPRLVDALKFEKARPGVAYILGEMGQASPQAVGALVKLLEDNDPQAEHEAAIALAKLGPKAKSAVPALTEALCGEPGTAYGAAYALGRIGPDAMDAKPMLLEAVGGKDESLALISAWALAQIQPDCVECAGKTLPIFVRSLSDPAEQYRLEAANSLRAMGPLAKLAVPALTKATKDENPRVREAAKEALAAIGR